MTFFAAWFRLLICPGLLWALLVGGLCQGIAAWLGAHLGRRPAPAAWHPLRRFLQLVRKTWPSGAKQSTSSVVWPAVLALITLSWGLGLMPWPSLPFANPDPLPGSYVLYVTLLAVPPLARLVAAGLSNHPRAALGVRQQAPLEVARLLPLLLASVTLPLITHQVGLPQPTVEDNYAALICLAVMLLILFALPWPLWDRDEYEAPLALVGGWGLALFRALEMIELAAHMGLVNVALGASGLLVDGKDWLAPAVSGVAVLVTLAVFEWRNRRLPTATATHRFTRWLFPAALLLVVAGWWVGQI